MTPFRVVAAIFAAAATCVGGLLLSGAFELPDPEAAILAVGPTLGQWTYLLVAVLTFLETGTLVGLAVPGEVTIVLGGFVAGQGVIHLGLLVPIVWAAAVAGDTTSYWLGRRLGRVFILRRGPRFGITPGRLEWAERYFASHGGKTIVVGRFLGLIRALAPFLAGTSKMPFRRFLLFDALGAGLWATTFSVLGWVFWQSLDRALELAGWGKLALLVALVLLVVAVLLQRLLRSPERRAPGCIDLRRADR